MGQGIKLVSDDPIIAIVGPIGPIAAGTNLIGKVQIRNPANTLDLGDQTNPLVAREQSASTSAQSSVAANLASVPLLAANAARLGATIFQDGGGTLLVRLGTPASAVNFTAQLKNNDYYEIPFGYTGIITGIWTAAVGSARITELTP